MRLDAVTIEYLADRERRGCNLATVAYYGKLLRWLGEYLASRDVVTMEAITTRLLEDYVTNLKQRPLELRTGRLSPVTVRKWTLSLKTFFAWAAGHHHIRDDPARLVPLPKKRTPLPKALSPDQARKLLLANMHNRERAIISLLLDSGIRLGELVALDLADIEHELMTVLIRHGKNDKQRVVVYADSTREALRAYLLERGMAGSAALFVAKDGRRLAADTVYKLVKRIGRSVDLDVSPHDLRHTFATLYLDGGGAIQDASALMGHAHISTTMIYTHVAIGTLRRKHQEFSPLNGLKK